MPQRPCLEPGCAEPASYRGRCPEHATRNDRQIRRAGRPIYNTRRWRNTRKAYLQQHPICERCNERLSSDVHHRIDIADGGDPWDWQNLEGMCRRCHSRETRRRQHSGAQA